MSHVFRFFGSQTAPDTWRLDAEETQHLTRVLRLGLDSPCEVTDGAGHWAAGKITSVMKDETVVSTGTVHFEPKNSAPAAIAFGALKHGDTDDLLPGLTELGADSIWIFLQSGADKSRIHDKAVQRWHKILRQAVKQCKRAWLPELHVFGQTADFIAAAHGKFRNRIYLAPDAPHDLAGLVHGLEQDIIMVAGGEQGLSAAEISALDEAGFRPASLGRTILRARTAALAATALASLARGDHT